MLGVLPSISVIRIIICFLTKPLTSGILFLTAANSGLVAAPPACAMSLANYIFSVTLTKPLVSGIFFSASLVFFFKSDLSVSYVVFKTNPVVSILSTFVTNLLYSVFLTTSFFTTLLSRAKSSGRGVNLQCLFYQHQFFN